MRPEDTALAGGDAADEQEWSEPRVLPKGSRLYYEHGWLCIRNATGWLLWSHKITEIPGSGLFMSNILLECEGSDSKPPNPLPSQPSGDEGLAK